MGRVISFFKKIVTDLGLLDKTAGNLPIQPWAVGPQMIHLHLSLPRAGERATRPEAPSLVAASADGSAGTLPITGAAIDRFLHVRGIAEAAIDRCLQGRSTPEAARDHRFQKSGIAGAAMDRFLQGRGTSGAALGHIFQKRGIAGPAIDRRLQARRTSRAARNPIFQKTSSSVPPAIRHSPFCFRHFPSPILPAASHLHPHPPDR